MLILKIHHYVIKAYTENNKKIIMSCENEARKYEWSNFN